MGITFRFLSVAAKQQYRWHSRVSVFQAGLYFRSILDVFENKLGEPNLTPAIIFFRFCPILDSDCFPSAHLTALRYADSVGLAVQYWTVVKRNIALLAQIPSGGQTHAAFPIGFDGVVVITSLI